MSRTVDIVSVVIPAFRAASTIASAVSTCAREDVVREIIVVVDGRDPKLEQAVPDLPNVRMIRKEKNRGAPAARNTGLTRVTSGAVLFLDADDYVSDGLVTGMCKVMLAHDADVVLAPSILVWPATGKIKTGTVLGVGPLDPLHILKSWLAGRYVPPCSVLWRTSFVRALWGVGHGPSDKPGRGLGLSRNLCRSEVRGKRTRTWRLRSARVAAPRIAPERSRCFSVADESFAAG
jgi:hypothetical protein